MSNTPLVPESVLQKLTNPCLARGSDFEIYTDALKIDENADPGRYLVRMVGSSTTQDLQGDYMATSALEDMSHVQPGLSIWLNHKYDVPHDIYGSLVESPKILFQNGIADLHLIVETEMDNPNASQTYTMITKNKRKLGCSIGCQVLDFFYDEDKDAVIIRHVHTVEWSVVGIPAQQRCWVETATKSLFERALLEGRVDDALQLAPAVKSMYQRSFDNLIHYVEDKTIRKELERTLPRGVVKHRLVYLFNDGNLEFGLSDNKGVTKSLTRSEVSSLLTSTEVEQSQKAVSGHTSFPLLDIGTEWTGSKAEKQIFDWARNADDEIIASKAKQCFLYTDPENSDKQSGYKMPFCYVEGSPKIVPLGVRAIAGILSGGMGGISASDADKSGMKAKVKTLYGRINREFKPDPEWVVPWEKDEEKSVKDVLDTTSGGPLNRQDIGETSEEKQMSKEKAMPNASDLPVESNGSHEACTGTHTHPHKAYGSQGEDTLHEHEHTHDGDANHGHSHAELENTDKALDAPQSVEVTPLSQEDALRTVYRSLINEANSIGARIDVAPVLLDKSLIPTNMDPQQVITTISQIDSLVDSLMDGFGIPDIDEGESVAVPVRYSIETQVQKGLESFFTVKEGRSISEKNQQQLQVIHDTVKAMHPGVCDGVAQSDGAAHQSSDTTQDEADQRSREMKAYQEGITKQIEAFSTLSQSLESLSMKDVVESAVTKSLGEAKQTIEALRREQSEVVERLNKLKTMPLGRPTSFIGRTVSPNEGTASYSDFLQKDANDVTVSLQEALAQTTISNQNGMAYRIWPEGVGGGMGSGVRPRLLPEQKTFMAPMDIVNYNEGKRAAVPAFDEVGVLN